MTLEVTLSNILNQLASFFSVSVDTITANAPQWLAAYGWHTVMSWASLAVVFIVAGIIAIAALCYMWTGDNWTKANISLVVILSIIWVIVVCAAWLLPCIVSPEIYGLKALLAVLKG